MGSRTFGPPQRSAWIRNTKWVEDHNAKEWGGGVIRAKRTAYNGHDMWQATGYRLEAPHGYGEIACLGRSQL